MSDADINRARRLSVETGERLARSLKRLGAASDIAIADALAAAGKLERVSSSEFPTERIEAGGISPQFLQDAAALPLSEDDETVMLAVADPTDMSPIEGVRLATGKPVDLKAAAFSDIEEAHIPSLWAQIRPLRDTGR